MSQRAKQKAETLRIIVQSASRLVRERGIDGMSVQEVMAGAGLTVGGFYAHFKNKDDLIKSAMEHALEEATRGFTEADGAKNGLAVAREIAHLYLSTEHRDNPNLGCPLPATLGTVSVKNSSAVLRKTCAGVIEQMAERVSAATRGDLSDKAVLGIMATVIGAQIMARATRGRDLSEKILESANQFVGLAVDHLEKKRD